MRSTAIRMFFSNSRGNLIINLYCENHSELLAYYGFIIKNFNDYNKNFFYEFNFKTFLSVRFMMKLLILENRTHQTVHFFGDLKKK